MIELQGIVQADGAHEALRGIDLKIAPGEVFGVIGRSGAGKSPYVNLITVREQDKDKPWVAKLVKAYQSEEVRKFTQTEFKGSVIPGF